LPVARSIRARELPQPSESGFRYQYQIDGKHAPALRLSARRDFGDDSQTGIGTLGDHAVLFDAVKMTSSRFCDDSIASTALCAG
jgi:hypothetical protein